ncbi:hypothetical protein HPMBJEAJ_00320 [Aeromonas phage avDM6]|nr:hypothetical protein HPMBJEAJ_00320 [Aeromonas phage avDM6]
MKSKNNSPFQKRKPSSRFKVVGTPQKFYIWDEKAEKSCRINSKWISGNVNLYHNLRNSGKEEYELLCKNIMES